MKSKPEHPREACGIFGIFGADQAADLTYKGLFALQHRGQEGGGIVVSNGQRLCSHKGPGLLSEVFRAGIPPELTGDRAIGHVRYSTTGSTRVQNIQPLVVECVDGLWAVAHNGNLTNADRLRQRYQDAGAIFQTSADSEVLLHLLADPQYRLKPRRVAGALAELRGAFSFLLMTPEAVMAARDPYGFRPLSIGRIGEAVVFASETCALTQVGATFERDVEPGELMTVDPTGMHSYRFAEKQAHGAQCVFEMVYFARPDSVVFGRNVHQVRMAYGRTLAREQPVDADIVVPVPDSGNSAALGYSHASGIPLDFGFIRNHYVGRTFIMPQQDARSAGVDMKLAVVPEVVTGKRLVVVDDSIVRGTTMRKRVARLRRAGATEVHVRISCPPTAFPCFYGVDFPTPDELVAHGRGVEDIREFIQADSLGYLSEAGLLSPFDNPDDFCRACFTSRYPVPVEGMNDKRRLERAEPELPFGEQGL